jgi:RNA polymerase sigma-70 factor (ECF subfamily)
MDDVKMEDRTVHAALADDPDPTRTGDWLEPIYREHARAVLATAYRVTGNAADAEDVLQTVFFRLARRDRAPDLGGGALPYLRRAATNAALDLVQARQRRRSASLEVVPARAVEDHRAPPDRVQIGRELREALQRAVASLGRRSAEMFVLRYFEDLDNRQIADLYATSPGTVAVTLHRARARLATELKPHFGGSS